MFCYEPKTNEQQFDGDQESQSQKTRAQRTFTNCRDENVVEAFHYSLTELGEQETAMHEQKQKLPKFGIDRKVTQVMEPHDKLLESCDDMHSGGQYTERVNFVSDVQQIQPDVPSKFCKRQNLNAVTTTDIHEQSDKASLLIGVQTLTQTNSELELVGKEQIVNQDYHSQNQAMLDQEVETVEGGSHQN